MLRVMNNTCNRDDTPRIDTLQVKIAFLHAGTSMMRWARENGYTQPTTWRVVHNHPSATGPTAAKIRKDLNQLIKDMKA